jgi:polyisoprenoid-binding protein YceI
MTTATATTTETLIPTGTWTVDPAHSRVEFRVKHLGIATVRGNFGDFEGTLEAGEGGVRAYGTVAAASVDTNDSQRDAHLRSGDFFEVERHPRIAFESTSIERTGERTFAISGELTLRGVTRELTLQAEIIGTEQDPYGNERVGLEVSGRIDRSDYGITFNQALGSGNVLVSDTVNLHLDISAVKQA